MVLNSAFFSRATLLVAALGPGWQFRCVNKQAQLLAVDCNSPLRLRLASAGGGEDGIAIEIVDEGNKPVHQSPNPVFWVVSNNVSPKKGAAALTKGFLDPYRTRGRSDRSGNGLEETLERGFARVFGHLSLENRSKQSEAVE